MMAIGLIIQRFFLNLYFAVFQHYILTIAAMKGGINLNMHWA